MGRKGGRLVLGMDFEKEKEKKMQIITLFSTSVRGGNIIKTGYRIYHNC